MLDFKIKSFFTGLATMLCICLQSYPAHAAENSRILYLIQTGNLCSALELYDQHREEIGEHDLDLVEKMGLILLDQGFRSSDPEIRLLTLFGSGISVNDRTQYILEEGMKTNLPQFQLISLSFLAKFQNDDAYLAINKAMSSDSLMVRLEAASLLAEMRHPKASGQIEALMQKVVPELLPIFPQLLAMAGDANSIRTLQRLMTSPQEAVRIEAILSAARAGRDDLLLDIRRLSTHLLPMQQEACAVALGMLKDSDSINRLRSFTHSKSIAVQLAALQALYRLGQEKARYDVERIAKEQNVFAITILGEMEGSEDVLYELTKNSNIHTRINAALALLQLRDPRCMAVLGEILVKDSRGLAFVKQQTYGKGLSAWKAIPSARQNLADDSIAFELSLHMREEVLEKTIELPEVDFLTVAHTLFELRQNDLVPHLSRLLENLQTPKALQLLKYHREQVGAPLIRNYCNLILYRLKEPGPYTAAMQEWMTSKQFHDLIQFRPMIPIEMRSCEPSRYLLTPEETSRLLVESFESLIQTQDDKAIDILLHAIQYGNPKNRYALAGLLIRATN